MEIADHPSLYAAFDTFPSAKGAATHIRHAAPVLFERLGGGLLYVLGDDELPAFQREDNGVEILRFRRPFPNFLERAIAFRRQLASITERLPNLRLAQFRDPWSGMALLSRRSPGGSSPYCRLIYEVNGLPSIELPHHFDLGESTVTKLRSEEERCWTEADHVVTPSEVLRENLVALGAPAEKITVVPNGADPPPDGPRPPGAPSSPYLIYFGALQAWQGVDGLLRAFALLRDLDLGLVICSSVKASRAKPLRKLAERLEIADRVVWQYRLRAQELGPWLRHAELSVAPLTECARNLEQGCCPLKILESMAAGIPLVASDLQVVREITGDDMARLVRPDRPSELARAIRVLLEYPEERQRMANRARQHLEASLTWRHSQDRLRAVYDKVLADQGDER